MSKKPLPLPPPLPPENRTVGQLVAETLKLYGNHFWVALALGAGPAVVGGAPSTGGSTDDARSTARRKGRMAVLSTAATTTRHAATNRTYDTATN